MQKHLQDAATNLTSATSSTLFLYGLLQASKTDNSEKNLSPKDEQMQAEITRITLVLSELIDSLDGEEDISDKWGKLKKSISCIEVLAALEEVWQIILNYKQRKSLL